MGPLKKGVLNRFLLTVEFWLNAEPENQNTFKSV